MAFGAFNPNRQHQMMSDINVTPMVDVMLVLLVIFILTAPMFTNAVKLELPRAQAAPSEQKAETVIVAIDAAGKLYWGEEVVDAAGLDLRLRKTAKRSPQPELQLRADKSVRYELVARVMAAAQTQGVTKLGFVTDAQEEAGNGKR